jgi:hypothetical protein
MPAVVKDSQMIRDKLISLDLPTNTRTFTTNAVTMNTKIDLNHAMIVMPDWMNVNLDNLQDWDFIRKYPNKQSRKA